LEPTYLGFILKVKESKATSKLRFIACYNGLPYKLREYRTAAAFCPSKYIQHLIDLHPQAVSAATPSITIMRWK